MKRRPRPYPSRDELARALLDLEWHIPSMFPSTVLSARPCLGCKELWPCPRYREATRIVAASDKIN